MTKSKSLSEFMYAIKLYYVVIHMLHKQETIYLYSNGSSINEMKIALPSLCFTSIGMSV